MTNSPPPRPVRSPPPIPAYARVYAVRTTQTAGLDIPPVPTIPDHFKFSSADKECRATFTSLETVKYDFLPPFTPIAARRKAPTGNTKGLQRRHTSHPRLRPPKLFRSRTKDSARSGRSTLSTVSGSSGGTVRPPPQRYKSRFIEEFTAEELGFSRDEKKPTRVSYARVKCLGSGEEVGRRRKEAGKRQLSMGDVHPSVLFERASISESEAEVESTASRKGSWEWVRRAVKKRLKIGGTGRG